MHPFVLFLLAIISPFLMLITLVIPIYAGVLGATYLIYGAGSKVNPLAEKMTDIFYIIEVYSTLFNTWLAHMKGFSLWGYSVPLLALPFIGILIALWLTGKLVRRLKNVFHSGVGM